MLSNSVTSLLSRLSWGFTHFLSVTGKLTVEGRGKEIRVQDFRSLTDFSTGFPHNAVDGNTRFYREFPLFFTNSQPLLLVLFKNLFLIWLERVKANAEVRTLVRAIWAGYN